METYTENTECLVQMKKTNESLHAFFSRETGGKRNVERTCERLMKRARQTPNIRKYLIIIKRRK